MAEQLGLVAQGDSAVLMVSDDLLQPGSEEPEEDAGAAAEEPEDDMGELDFTYDDSLLQGDEEEDPAVLATQETEHKDQESERRKQEQFERKWDPSIANALPAHTSEIPAHSRHSSYDHADRHRAYQRSHRPEQLNRGRDPNRGRSSFPHGREAMQDTGRRVDPPRGPSLPAAASGRRQPPAGPPAASHQYSRPVPPGSQQQGQEFDPSLLYSMFAAPSFAPVPDDVSQHKRKHDQMQVPTGMSLPLPLQNILTPELMHNVQQLSQQGTMPQGHAMHQMRPDGQPNGTHLPAHHMMGPAVPPPRPPQGPPPAGHTAHISHSASIFARAPNFSPVTSNAVKIHPQAGHSQAQQVSRLGPSGWSLSHGMDGPDRAGGRQEATLAADMVWDTEASQASSRETGAVRAEPFRSPATGPVPRNGLPAAGAFTSGPRVPAPRPPQAMSNKAAELAKNPAALAAAKARFEQQQKENDEISERNKRQRMGLPAEPKPAYQEGEIDRLKRQIAEKEAAVKAAQAQLPTSTRSAPPSPTKGKSQSVSPSPSSAPGGSTPPSTSGSGHRSHRVERSAIQPDSTDPGDVDRWRATEEGRSRSSRGSKDMKVKDGDGHGHVKHNGSSHGQHEQRDQQQSDHPHRSHRSSQDRSRDAGFRDQQQSDHPHRSHRSKAQAVTKDQHPGYTDREERQDQDHLEICQ